MALQKILRIDETLAADVKAIATHRRTSENQIMLEALRYYRDREYMQNKATIINEEVMAVLQASYRVAENTINNKANRVLSEVAIQACIQNQILAKSLQISQSELTTYRLRALEFLRDHQRVIRMDELNDE